MEDLIKPFILERDDYCTNCRTQKTIELYNIYDKPMRYSNLLSFANNINLDSVLDKTVLSYMKCKKCGKIYKICWKDHKPAPMVCDPVFDDFMQNYR